MNNYPEYPLFAVVKNGYIIDGAFGGEDGVLYSIFPPNTKTYSEKDQLDFILVSEEEQFFEIGQYVGNALKSKKV